MNDDELNNQIGDLLEKAFISKSGDEDNQFTLLKQAFKLYDQLSSKSKKAMKNSLYYAQRDLGRLYFLRNKYKESLKYLEESKKLSGYLNEDFTIRLWMDHFIVSSRIKLFFITNSKSYLKQARTINDYLLKSMDEIEVEELKLGINSNKSVLEAMKEGGRIKTVICFEIPPALPIQKNSPIKFKFNGIDHILKIEIIKNPSAFIDSEGSYVEIIEDKYGLVNRSKIKLTIFKYLDPNEQVEIKTFSDKELQFKIILDALNALNYFIERYKIETGSYWIEPVFYKMIKNFTFENIVEGQTQRRQMSLMNHLTLVSPDIPWMNDAEVANFKKCLEKKKIDLWEILLLDAKDYLLKSSYREAIYAINGAFENYLMLKAHEKLTKAWDEESVNRYLKGEPIYKYHNLKGYMNEEDYDRAVKDKKIGSYVPPTGQILKKCYDAHPLAISHTQLDKLVKKIRKHRNKVMHGVNIDDDLEIVAFEAINSFEEFIKLFN